MRKAILGCVALVACLANPTPGRAAPALCCTHVTYVCFEAPSPVACGINAAGVQSCDECVAPTPSGAVPAKEAIPEMPLTLSKISAAWIRLAWAASCVASDSDYAVYEGLLGDFASHVPASGPLCTTFGMLTLTIEPSAGDQYYLVVPLGDMREGSYGVDSDGAPRPPSQAACRHQLVEICP